MNDPHTAQPIDAATARASDRSAARRFLHFLLGNAANVVLSALLGLYTARVLGPHDKGVLALAQGSLGILTTALGLGASHAAAYYARARPGTLRIVLRYVRLHVAGGGLATALLLLLFSEAAGRVFLDGRTVDRWFWIALGISSLLALLNTPQLAIATALGNARRVAISTNAATVVTILGTLLLLRVLDSPLHAAFLAIVAGQLVAVGLLQTATSPPPAGDAEELPYVAFLKFGLVSYVGAVASLIFKRLDLFVVGYLLDTRAVGLYAVALSLRDIALTVCRATSAVVGGELADPVARASGAAQRTLWRALGVNATFSTCTIAGAYLLLPSLLPLLYGQAYAPAVGPSLAVLVSTLPLSLIIPIAAATVSGGKPFRVSAAHVVSGILGLGGPGSSRASTV